MNWRQYNGQFIAIRQHVQIHIVIRQFASCRLLYYAVHAFAHVHTFAHVNTFAHFHRFGSIDTFQFTFLLKKKTIDKVTIIDKES